MWFELIIPILSIFGPWVIPFVIGVFMPFSRWMVIALAVVTGLVGLLVTLSLLGDPRVASGDIRFDLTILASFITGVAIKCGYALLRRSH